MTTAHITDHSSATPARGGRGGSGGRSRRATGIALARLAAVARWTLAVAACLWIALCVAVGPLYWADSSIADFGAVNWLFAVVGFLVPFAAVVAMTRWANGIPVFGWSSGTAPDSGGRTSRGRAAPGIRSRLVGQPDRTVPRPGMRTCHRPVVENRTDPVHRLALGADDAAVRVRRRHPLSGSRVQLGLEPMDRPGSAVYRILLIRADGHLSDRALHMAVESDVPDRSAQHRADGTVWCRAVGLPVFHRFQRCRIRGAVIRAVPVRRVLLRRHRQPVLQLAVAAAPRRH